MQDYKNISAVDAMREAKDAAGMTADEIAEAAGLSPAVVRRYLKREDDYTPGLDKIPVLCRAMQNVVLLRWIEAQLEQDLPKKAVRTATSRADILTAVAGLAATLGDVQRKLYDNASIDPACARDLRGLLADVVDECKVCSVMLQALARHTDKTECEPLASVTPTSRWRGIWWG